MTKKQKIICASKSPVQTKKTGFLLAQTILKGGPQGQALVLLLRGDLGAGKTTFMQGFAKGLGVKETINSPTFVILKKYPLNMAGGFKYFYHIDCYRLGGAADFEPLGIKEILRDAANIVAIEWPEVVGDWGGEEILRIDFETVNKEERYISFGD